ncbi:MAG: methyl-accepting chemotaxis protein [Clostridia bacterium]|nr:methyl-accepting chemotaxis protein [Clostridia bacterium]MDD4145788.1 methyl-accepting chemotaxis protein [Clostridia bacterium]MDD4665675.1 methyl-accepting chemotaxis protein [Clostridia bacterium]
MQEKTMLDYLIKVAPLVNQFIASDLGVAICDKAKWLLYIPAYSLDVKIKVGDPVLSGGAAYLAMQRRGRVLVEVDESLYGVSYIAVGFPIIDNEGEVLGAIVTSENMQRKEMLFDLARGIQGFLQNIQASIQEIAAEAQALSATSQELRSVAEDATVKVESTAGILDTVKQISKRTNLIGLNASIEAARVGEYGRGFNVVANEVRNLSQMTNRSTAEIGSIVRLIKEAINSIANATQVVSEVTQSQAEKLSGINLILEEFRGLSEKLVQTADDLLENKAE